MTASTTFACASQDLMAAIGGAATFTMASGDIVSLYAYLEHNVDLQPYAFESMTFERGSTIEVSYSDIGREPNKGETFDIDGTTWTVKTVLENDGYFVKMVVKQ